MGVVAKMVCTKVDAQGGLVWKPCTEDYPGARRPAEVFENYTYGVPGWLKDAEWVAQEPGTQSVTVALQPVSAKGQDDPNREWAEASPTGEFRMTIQNPAAMAYYEPGVTYLVETRKCRDGQHPWVEGKAR